MYTLSRLLPDGSERPIVSGPPGRAGGESEPAACEFLPDESVKVAWLPTGHEDDIASTELARFEMTRRGSLHFLPGKRDCTPSLAMRPGGGELAMVLLDGDRQVATLRYLEDIRVFIQVFPHGVPQASAPAE